MSWTEHDRIRAYLPLAAQIAAVAGTYYGASRLGMMAASFGQMSPFWPASGIALVALMTFGLRVTPGILLGSLPLEITLVPNFAAALGSSVGDTLAPLCAYVDDQEIPQF
ncbi:MAG: MASE1 domain-containing protein [Actinopolymorphaceae bacterium]